MEERAGVCRHGAQSFKAAADALGLDTRIAGNDIHQFNELLSENARKHLDFGGATSEDGTLNFQVRHR
jgi:hypothetical protein